MLQASTLRTTCWIPLFALLLAFLSCEGVAGKIIGAFVLPHGGMSLVFFLFPPPSYAFVSFITANVSCQEDEQDGSCLEKSQVQQHAMLHNTYHTAHHFLQTPHCMTHAPSFFAYTLVHYRTQQVLLWTPITLTRKTKRNDKKLSCCTLR